MALVRPSMIVERKPLSLPPPVIFAPRPVHTTLQNSHLRGIHGETAPPAPPVFLPPTPPPPPYDPSAAPPALSDLRQNADGSWHVRRGEPNGAANETTGPKVPIQGPVEDAGVVPEYSQAPPEVQLRRGPRQLSAGQKKAPAYDFIYADEDTFENEINEFHNFQDKPQMLEGREVFEASFKGQWKGAKRSEKANCVGCLLEQLELRDPELRYKATTKLLYIAQGCFGEAQSQEEHLQSIRDNNVLLFELGALDHVFAALKVVSVTLDLLTRVTDPQLLSNERQYAMDLATGETSAHMCVLFFLLKVNGKEEAFSQEITNTNPPLAAFLFGLVAQLAEGNRKHYPVKKLLLLLWNVLLVCLGDTKRLSELKSASRTLEGLPAFDESLLVKSVPQDYLNYHTSTAARYPAYVTPDPSILLPPRKTLPEGIPGNTRRNVQQPCLTQPYTSPYDSLLPAMFQESVDLYKKHNYTSASLVQISREKDRVEKEESSRKLSGDNDREQSDLTDPADDESNGTPSEFGSERRREVSVTSRNLKQNAQRIRKEDAVRLKRFETLYRHLLPHMATHIGMLIRLLYYVNLGSTTVPGGKPDGEGEKGGGLNDDLDPGIPFNEMTPEEQRSHLLRVDNNRHKEVVTKAVSGILMILLKATKCHHALKFEYISQLMVDNNCAILILKMLSAWLQNPTIASPNYGGPPLLDPQGNPIPWEKPKSPTAAQAAMQGMGAVRLTKRDEPAELDFFYFARRDETEAGSGCGKEPAADDTTKQTVETDAPSTAYPTRRQSSDLLSPDAANGFTGDDNGAEQKTASSFRNFYTAINLLRILQKLTKRKTHRILALVQWKASAVLKRAMKVNHVGLQLYALKLLKSQIPYLGKKWRSSNMKVVTAIFVHLRPYLRDEYLAGDVDVDVDEALAHEQKLRSLIASYHEHRYSSLEGLSPAPATHSADEESATHSHVDELDLILSISRRASYQGATDPQIHAIAAASGTRNGPPSSTSSTSSGSVMHAYDQLTLDANFLENYEEWLRMEVYEPDSSDSPTSPSDHVWSHNGSFDPDSADANQQQPPRSLFSATQRFSKEMLSDYDDTEWDPSNNAYYYEFPGDDVPGSQWDEPVDVTPREALTWSSWGDQDGADHAYEYPPPEEIGDYGYDEAGGDSPPSTWTDDWTQDETREAHWVEPAEDYGYRDASDGYGGGGMNYTGREYHQERDEDTASEGGKRKRPMETGSIPKSHSSENSDSDESDRSATSFASADSGVGSWEDKDESKERKAEVRRGKGKAKG
ncbi:uncharacterized protein EV422DRAFT_590026 [Fimicolochytrium jonesii]|uniref:uncharacterized protein n=1 Tax=Fimicolochytrium jonesii TaxID=1396493 RepID=UPI0022FE4519|nr:uncharacterized protein EV422DRAFT_590026 [Fimicolochytrium jonesii]KAI8817952.1 hypothetical protein EV422DRAFT_590026 [Fimicolochytrium jonesii]